MQYTQDSLPRSTEDGFTASLPTGSEAVEFLRLIIATDSFPRGGIFHGYYCTAAALRYELIWLNVLKEQGLTCMPPLDVALVWLVHRQYPISYANTTTRRCDALLHPPPHLAFAFSGEAAAKAWRDVAGEHPLWPPPPPGSEHDLEAANGVWQPALALQLAESLARLSWQLRSWLRPHFLDAAFLERARTRYGRFLRLVAAHPSLTLVPTADIALMWHTHLGLSGRYQRACEEVLGLTADSQKREGLEEGEGQEQQPGHQGGRKDGSDGGPRGKQRDGDGGGSSSEGGEGAAGGDRGGCGDAGAHKEAVPRMVLGADGRPVQPLRPLYLALDLEGDEVQEAYGMTARLYETTYGEPYITPDTAWVLASESHPLESSASPVSFALTAAFEAFPGAGGLLHDAPVSIRSRSTTTVISGVRRYGSVGGVSRSVTASPRPWMPPPTPGRRQQPSHSHSHYHNQLYGVPSSPGPLTPFQQYVGSPGLARRTASAQPLPPVASVVEGCRGGGHALYAAWVVSRQASKFFSSQTCGGVCFRSSWSIRMATVQCMAGPLADLPFMGSLLDSSIHPFLQAVRVRQGLWHAPDDLEDGANGYGDKDNAKDNGDAAQPPADTPEPPGPRKPRAEQDPPQQPHEQQQQQPAGSPPLPQQAGPRPPRGPGADQLGARRPLLSRLHEDDGSGSCCSSENSVEEGLRPWSAGRKPRHVCFFSPAARSFTSRDAEVFLDHADMVGLAALIDANQAAGGMGSGYGGTNSSDPGEAAGAGGGAESGTRGERASGASGGGGASADPSARGSQGKGWEGIRRGGSSAGSTGGEGREGKGEEGAPPAAPPPRSVWAFWTWFRRLPGAGAGTGSGGSGGAGGSTGAGGVGKTGGDGRTSPEPGLHLALPSLWSDSAPLWEILHDPKYAQRARAYYEHVWSHALRRLAGDRPSSTPRKSQSR